MVISDVAQSSTSENASKRMPHIFHALLSQRIYSERVVTRTNRSKAAKVFSLQPHLPRLLNNGQGCDVQQKTILLLQYPHVRFCFPSCGFAERKILCPSHGYGISQTFDQSLDSTVVDRRKVKSSFNFTKSVSSGRRSARTSTGCPPCFMKKLPCERGSLTRKVWFGYH